MPFPIPSAPISKPAGGADAELYAKIFEPAADSRTGRVSPVVTQIHEAVNGPLTPLAFKAGAAVYPELGWPVLPVNADKSPALAGHHGREGVDADAETLSAWVESRGGYQCALRMPSGVIGIDVDHYGGKYGGHSVVNKIMSGLPKLPTTYKSSSRDGISGIYFYRVPAGVEFKESLIGGAVEIIERHNRVAVVWPSMHQRGAVYRWFYAGLPVDGPPAVEDLPELPTAWVDFLARKSPSRTRGDGYRVAGGDGGDASELLDRALTGGMVTPEGRRILNDCAAAMIDGAGGHQAVMTAINRLVSDGVKGAPGVAAAMSELEEMLIDYRDGDDRTACGEFARMLDPYGGVGDILRANASMVLGGGSTPAPFLGLYEDEDGTAAPEPEPVQNAAPESVETGRTDNAFLDWDTVSDTAPEPVTDVPDTALVEDAGRLSGALPVNVKNPFDALAYTPPTPPKPKPGTPTLPRPEDVEWILTKAEAEAAGWNYVPPLLRDGKTRDTSFDPYDRERFPKGHPSAPDLLAYIGNYNDVTRLLFHKARSGYATTSPVAAVLAHFTRVGYRLNPRFLTFTGAPLSTYVITLASSGKGKTTAMDADKVVPIPPPPGRTPPQQPNSTTPGIGIIATPKDWWNETTSSIGSGEVLGHLMCHMVEADTPGTGDEAAAAKRVRGEMVKVPKDHPALLIVVDEVRALLKKGGAGKNNGNGATIFDALNTAWPGKNPSAETLSNKAAPLVDKEFAVYLFGGLQPKEFGRFESEDTGFVQRCILAPVTDPWRTGMPDLVPLPAPGTHAPSWPSGLVDGGRFTASDEPDGALAIAAGLSDIDYSDNDDPRDSHVVNLRIRLACLTALALRGSTHVTEDDWRYAGFLIEAHHRTRAYGEVESERASAEEAVKAGREMGLRDVAKNDQKVDSKERAGASILRKLSTPAPTADGLWTRNGLSKAMKKTPGFAEALSALVAECRVVETPNPARKGSTILSLVG